MTCCKIVVSEPKNWGGHRTILLRQNFPGKIFLFSSFSILFHSIQEFLRTNRPFVCFISFLFPEKISRTFSFFFFDHVFLASFFHHSLFLFITFRIHLGFSFPFLLDLLFSWSPSSQLIFLVLHFQFSLNQFLLPVVSKKIKDSLLHAWVTYQCPFCSHTSQKIFFKKTVHFPCCWTLFHIYLFLHVCPFFDFSFFVLFSCLKTFFFFVLFFECCLFTVGPFLCIFFFFWREVGENSVWLDHRFSTLLKNFSFYILSLLHKKNNVFLNCSFCAVSFFSKETVSCLLVLQGE